MSTRKQPRPAKGAKRLSWKANLLFAAVILTAAALLVFLLRPRSKGGTAGSSRGFRRRHHEVLPLDKDYDYLYDVGSYVVHLQVKDGTISFQDSQCPDHVCEQFGQLSEEGAWRPASCRGVCEAGSAERGRSRILTRSSETPAMFCKGHCGCLFCIKTGNNFVNKG